MKKYCGGADFKTLYHNFITDDTSEKVFVMSDYKTESVELGAGATIHLKKAEPFLLNIIKDWFLKNPHVLIGDIPSFLKMIDNYEKKYIKDRIKRGKEKFERVPKVALQLHNILRKQQGIKR